MLEFRHKTGRFIQLSTKHEETKEAKACTALKSLQLIDEKYENGKCYKLNGYNYNSRNEEFKKKLYRCLPNVGAKLNK